VFKGTGKDITYSAVLNNAHGDDLSFEALYAVLALQMLRNAMRHAVGFFKRAPWLPQLLDDRVVEIICRWKPGEGVDKTYIQQGSDSGVPVRLRQAGSHTVKG